MAPTKVLVLDEATKKVSPAVLLRCGHEILRRRSTFPPQPWLEEKMQDPGGDEWFALTCEVDGDYLLVKKAKPAQKPKK